jgi:hypothetical protein
VFVVHKTSNCLFTTETEFDIYLLNLGKMLIMTGWWFPPVTPVSPPKK